MEITFDINLNGELRLLYDKRTYGTKGKPKESSLYTKVAELMRSGMGQQLCIQTFIESSIKNETNIEI